MIHRSFATRGWPRARSATCSQPPTPDARSELIAGRLEGQLDRIRAAVASLGRVPQLDPAPLDVELRKVRARTVAAVRDTVHLGEVLDRYDEAMSGLGRNFAVLGLTGRDPLVPATTRSCSPRSAGDCRVCLRRRPPTVGRVLPLAVPACELAVVMHAARTRYRRVLREPRHWEPRHRRHRTLPRRRRTRS